MKNLLKSLAGFQQECPIIYKSTKAYNYKYADFPTILEIISPILKKHGLGFVQPLDGDKLKTIVFHVETGEQIESSVNIKQDVKLSGQNDFQVLGSAITYYRRYSLESLLGLVTSKDTDAVGKQVEHKEKEVVKKWLIKDTEQFSKAVKYLKDGGNMVDILNSYNVSKVNQELLLKEAK